LILLTLCLCSARRRTLLPSHRDIARTFGQSGRVDGSGAGSASDGNASADDTGSASDVSPSP
jgi:hypothetical protein